MKIKFENVGRFNKTWIAEYPAEVPLEIACRNTLWWPRQLAHALRSDPEWAYNEKDKCVDIFAGWHCVGRAVVVEGGAE